jgi:hypothetical protein
VSGSGQDARATVVRASCSPPCMPSQAGWLSMEAWRLQAAATGRTARRVGPCLCWYGSGPLVLKIRISSAGIPRPFRRTAGVRVTGGITRGGNDGVSSSVPRSLAARCSELLKFRTQRLTSPNSAGWH